MDMMPPPDPGPSEPGQGLRIGLINNMPDPALRRTEQQVRSLLGAACDGLPIELVMTTLPEIARIDWAAQHVAESYCGVDAFQVAALDAVVVTGAEPKAAHLSDETYWPALTGLFDWIEQARMPAAYCCLAAHAAVLHRDGIERRPLAQKCSGVFDHVAVPGHAFTQGVDMHHVLPHSRWNEIAESDLATSDYVTLSRSQEAGVGAFARANGGTDLFFQGHPEYSSTTLLREYRRDVRRFLTGERDIYPQPPFHSIQDDLLGVFEAFRARALLHRDAALFEDFPSFASSDARSLPWRPAASQIYRRWLESVVPDLTFRMAAAELIRGLPQAA